MIITTTPSIEDRKIVEYCGIVAAEQLIVAIGPGGAGMQKPILKDMREATLQEMQSQAEALDADAIIRVDINYKLAEGDDYSMVLVSVSGTAVKLG